MCRSSKPILISGIQISCREIRDLKSQLSSQEHGFSNQSLQEVVRERDAVKADRNRLLGRVSQLEKDNSKLDSVERLKAASVSATCLVSSLPASKCSQMLSLHIQVEASATSVAYQQLDCSI